MSQRQLINRPVFIIGCNRSGTTLLFRTLSLHPSLWSLYEEGQHIFYRHYPVDGKAGDRVVDPPEPEVAVDIVKHLFTEAHNKEFFADHSILKLIPPKALQRPLNRLYKRAPIRIIEKTPANCFRVPFLATTFPDALFIFLIRRAEEVISSLMEGWKYWSGTGAGAWQYRHWHYLVPPGWQTWAHRSLEEICAFQWVESNRVAWKDLNRVCAGRFLLIRYEEVLADSTAAYTKIAEFCELPESRFFNRKIRRPAERSFTHGGSRPRLDKWKELHRREVDSVRHMFQPLMHQLFPAP